MPHRPNCPVVMFLIRLLATSRPASAEVTRIEYTSKQPYGTFRVGDYVIWQGRIHGDFGRKRSVCFSA